ncbi:MAG: aspartate kinase [Oscillospiraceae bacterium]|nr:aspartate kinase [Clostridiales bacterium]MDD6107210.1 aspartate kinase [Clostridiales bacterium]MDY5595281.1 aspartate kinase [Oscillospiraceae bacterium]MDY6095121.1 aspartate kinase [Oscillospiraceae bacterium]
MLKVVKFGGSSMADAKQFAKVRSIVQADPARRVVVVSAAGKRSPDDHKLTDLLYLCYAHLQYGVSCDSVFQMIADRYVSIRDECGLSTDIESELAALRAQMERGISQDELVSRGEYFSALLMADYLGFDFLDAKLWLKFKFDGSIDQEASYEELRRLAEGRSVVIPGFYGVMPDGRIRTLTRGGSDITGALAAAALDADVYENWTDVSGILMADPRIVENPLPIERITYNELRELSFVGAQVLHEGTVFPVREKNIPLNIRNTNDPDHPGTLIMEEFDDSEDAEHRFITGIAGKKNFSIVTIAKNGMSSTVGTFRQIFEIFESHGVSIEYAPSGIDCLSLVVSSDKVAPCLYSILGEIQKALKPDSIHVTENISIVAAVGRKMVFQPGVSGKIFATLGENGINIRMISQGPDELNIIVGVDTKDFASTIQVLYNSFVK